MTLKVATILQSLGVALQATVPQVTSDHTQQTIYAVSIGIAQLAAGIAAMFYNPNGSSAREPYVKKRKSMSSFTGLMSFALLFALVAPAFSEVVKMDGYQPVYYKRNLTWAATGATGTDNTFWFAPVDKKNPGFCLAITNKTGAAKTLTSLNVYYTFDPSATVVATGLTWPVAKRVGSMSTTIPLGYPGGLQATNYNYFLTQGASKVAIKFVGGAGAGTIDIMAIESGVCGSNTGYTAVTANGASTVWERGNYGQSYLAGGSLTAVPFAAMTAISTASTATGTAQLHVCGFTNTTAGPLSVTIQDGSGVKLLDAYVIATKDTKVIDFWSVMSSNWQWQASAVGINGYCWITLETTLWVP